MGGYGLRKEGFDFGCWVWSENSGCLSRLNGANTTRCRAVATIKHAAVVAVVDVGAGVIDVRRSQTTKQTEEDARARYAC